MKEEQNYAGFWIRVLSYFIDTIILGIGGGIVGMFVAIYMIASGVEVSDEAMEFWFNLLGVIIALIYFPLFEASKFQATPGKLALNLKVINDLGERISYGQAYGRYFAKILSGIILYIGFIMIAFTENKQGLHDLLASSYVVKK
jgi:uncharacterized RDD family membrane protein YckC